MFKTHFQQFCRALQLKASLWTNEDTAAKCSIDGKAKKKKTDTYTCHAVEYEIQILNSSQSNLHMLIEEKLTASE